MKRFEAAFGHWVLRHRVLIILATLLLVAVAVNGAKNLGFTTDYRVFFSADNPQLLAFEALESMYSKNDNVMFVISPKEQNVFTRKTLAAVEKLTQAAWQIPYSTRVDSVTNYQHTEAVGDDLSVMDLVRDAAGLEGSEIEKIRKIAMAEPLLLNHLVSARGHTTGVNVTVQLPGKNPMTETPEVMRYVRELAQQVRDENPGMEVRLVGMVIMNNAFNEASQDDMKTLVPLSFVIMLVSLAILLRGITGTVVTLLVIVFSVLTAMGIGGYIGFPITPPTASTPTIILTIAIANSVHILVTFLHGMRHGRSKHDAIVESLRVNLQPVFLTSLTTALGFLSMLFSEVPPFQHLGILVSIGVMASFIFSVTFLPAVTSLLPIRVRHIEHGKDTLMDSFASFVIGRKNTLFWGMAIAVVTLISFVPRNELNDIFVHYFDSSYTFRQDVDYAAKNLSGMDIIDYSVESGEAGGISNPEFLAEMEAFSEWYLQQPETEHVNTLTDIMKRLNMNMHGNDRDWYRIPAQRDLSAQYLLLYEMSLPYGLDLNNQVNVDKSATRMVVTTRTLSSNEMLALEQRAQEWLAKNTTHIKRADGNGTTVMFAHIGKRNITSMIGGTTVALIMISLLLIVAFRSVKIGMVSMIPNLVPAAMGFGLWGMLVGEVGLGLSVVMGMTLGIVVDDTVHFLSKYLRARRELGLHSEEAVRYAFTTVGRALLITSVVLVAGFLILALSGFKLNAGMGLLTATVIFFALAADFLFLPPLLMKFEEKRDAHLVDTGIRTDYPA